MSEQIDLKYEYIRKNWHEIKKNVLNKALSCGRRPEEIKVIAVSKTHRPEKIEAALNAGIELFGENYVQELTAKYEYLSNKGLKPKWHFIGHLQTNKVKYIVPFIDVIHTVDSIKLANEIEKWADKNNRIIDILVQVNTSGEDSKYGCEPEETEVLVKSILLLKHMRIKGLMTIGTFSDDETVIRSEFQLLRNLMLEINKNLSIELTELSMGMTHDYEIAIEEGATYLRIGTAIFGARIY